jgi:hypothetical protein
MARRLCFGGAIDTAPSAACSVCAANSHPNIATRFDTEDAIAGLARGLWGADSARESRVGRRELSCKSHEQE